MAMASCLFAMALRDAMAFERWLCGDGSSVAMAPKDAMALLRWLSSDGSFLLRWLFPFVEVANGVLLKGCFKAMVCFKSNGVL